MKLGQVGIIVSIVSGVIAIWYYLRDTPTANLVTYPNTQASGQPASQNAATVFNIAAPSPLPSPNLIYGAPPPLPQTPAYQNYNYSPINLLGLTQQGAAATPTPSSSGKGDSCGCASSCGCGSCATGGSYLDGIGSSCLASNPAQQIEAGHGAMYEALAFNIKSSSVGPDAGQPGSDAPAPSPVAQAAVIPSQAQGLSQGQVSVPPAGIPPSLGRPLLSWLQFEVLAAINSGGGVVNFDGAQ